MALENFWERALRQPERVAVIDSFERRVLAGNLLAEANRLSHGLRALGLRRGDAIAAMLPTSLEALELYLASQQLGLYLTPINFHFVGPEIAYILRDCEARAFIAHERYAGPARAALSETLFPAEHLFAIGSITGFRSASELEAAQPSTLPDERSLGALMNYTSGTTGRPKGVRRPLLPGAIEDTDLGAPLYRYGIGRDEPDNVHLLACPWYHTAPLVMVAPSLHLGHTVVVMDRFDPEHALELIDRYRVTITHMVPTQFVRMLALSDEQRRKFDCCSLRHVIHGAAPCSVDVKRQMIAWLGPVLDEYYASTEGVGGTIISSEEWLRKPGSVGKPSPGQKIIIMDEHGNELPPGQVGLVYSTSLHPVPFEYYKDPEKTRNAKRGEYSTVGDMGYVDHDGYLFLTDRKVDMIVSGGVNIYPAEIESVLITHPLVEDVAVFGIPNREWGEEVKAVVQIHPNSRGGGDDALRAELLGFLEGRLARYKLPRSIDFTDQLPRDPNGKLYKRRLRDRFWAGRQRLV